MLGYETIGQGARWVIVLNDWIGDTSSWDGARAYLDGEAFTWTFADLRGYGRSKDRAGAHTVDEAAADVLALADALGVARFAIVGHSMSTLVALHLAQHWPDRIERAVVVTPPPPRSFGADQARIDAMQAVARGDDQKRLGALTAMLGDRLSKGFIRAKAARWRTADAEAIADYVLMFARHGLPDPETRIACPLLAVTGEQDAEIMRKASVANLLAPLSDRLTVTAIEDSGHYPMQETPALLVAIVERFLER